MTRSVPFRWRVPTFFAVLIVTSTACSDGGVLLADAGDAAAVVPTGDGNVKQSTATPTFSVPGNTYTTAQSVSLASATTGAAIYYTLDENTPSQSSQQYGAPISVSATTTIRAIAIAPGYEPSVVNSATYTIEAPPPRAATPTITPASGTYASTQEVSIGTTETNATLLFTTNGSFPVAPFATVYTKPFVVSVDTTVIAIAKVSNKSDSLEAKATYKISNLAGTIGAPSFSPAAGEYAASQSITMTTSPVDATICYTIDGNIPSCDATLPIAQMCNGTSARYITTTPPVFDGNPATS